MRHRANRRQLLGSYQGRPFRGSGSFSVQADLET